MLTLFTGGFFPSIKKFSVDRDNPKYGHFVPDFGSLIHSGRWISLALCGSVERWFDTALVCDFVCMVTILAHFFFRDSPLESARKKGDFNPSNLPH